VMTKDQVIHVPEELYARGQMSGFSFNKNKFSTYRTGLLLCHFEDLCLSTNLSSGFSRDNFTATWLKFLLKFPRRGHCSIKLAVI
jgi:hypothetical protein